MNKRMKNNLAVFATFAACLLIGAGFYFALVPWERAQEQKESEVVKAEPEKREEQTIIVRGIVVQDKAVEEANAEEAPVVEEVSVDEEAPIDEELDIPEDNSHLSFDILLSSPLARTKYRYLNEECVDVLGEVQTVVDRVVTIARNGGTLSVYIDEQVKLYGLTPATQYRLFEDLQPGVKIQINFSETLDGVQPEFIKFIIRFPTDD